MLVWLVAALIFAGAALPQWCAAGPLDTNPLFANLYVESFANLSGGDKTGSSVFGVLEFGAELDLEPLFGWTGITLYAHAFWFDGEDPTAKLVGDFNGISNLAAVETTRLYQAWLRKSSADDRWQLKLGLLSIDDDFLISEYSALFINSGFGTPPTITGNAGVATYPLGALGVVLRFAPHPSRYFQLGIYDGDTGTQGGNLHGLDIQLGGGDGVVVWAEAGFDLTLLGALGTHRFGGYYHTGRFSDLPTGVDASSGYLLYYNFDQALVHDAAGVRLAGFVHASYSGPSDRHAVAFHVRAGGTWFHPRSNRSPDALGLAVLHTRFSDHFREPSSAQRRPPSETVVELTYAAELTADITLQPSLQFILNPPFAEENAIVVSARLTWAF